MIGEVNFRQGFLAKALEYAQEAAGLSVKGHLKDQTVLANLLLSEISVAKGDLEQASKNLKTSIEFSKSLTDRKTKSQLRLGIARYFLAKDSLDKALEEATEAERELKEIAYQRGLADCYQVLGMVHELRVDPDKSVQFLESALAEHSALGDKYGKARDLTALGVHYKNIGETDKAMENFVAALDIRKTIGDKRGYAATLANIGNLNRHLNRMVEAREALQSALAVFRECGDKKGEADTLTNLGHLEASKGAQAVALENFYSALKLHRDVKDNRGILTDLISLSSLYLAERRSFKCSRSSGRIGKNQSSSS